MPDHTLTLGERTYYYFLRDRAEEIREALGLPRVDDTSIRELFLDFVERMDMSSSYKPVMLLAILDHVDDRGRASIDDTVASAFHAFYLDRLRQGLGRRASRDADGPGGSALARGRPLAHARDAVPEVRAAEVPGVRQARPGLSPVPAGAVAAAHRRGRATLRGHCERAISEYYERLES